MRIFKYELEDALQSLDNSVSYAGFINKLFPKFISKDVDNINTITINGRVKLEVRHKPPN
ncbi:hypothetical protein AB71192_03764 [Acinetobacter baumannii]|nr:hypothetical protein AB71192_03764 [Acinetobacter baumannii]